MAGAISMVFDSLTAGKILAGTAIFLIMSMLFEFFVIPPRYPKIPTVGHGEGFVAGVKNLWAYAKDYQKWLGDGYKEYNRKGKAFKTPRILSKPPDIVLPKSQTMWMLNQPDNVLSQVAAHESILNTGINFLDPDFRTDDFHSRVIHKNLARSLNKLIPKIQEEVAFAVDKSFGTDAEGEWRHVNLWDAWLTIVPTVTSRMLVGYPLNRDEEYIDSMVKFTNCVVRNNFVLNMTPKLLHPLVGKILTLDSAMYWRRAAKKTLPIIRERMRALEAKEAGDKEYEGYALPDDFISWTVKLAREEEKWDDYDAVRISKRLLPVTFAAIHTTALTGHSALLDLFSDDPAKGAVLGVREEIARVFAEEGGQWTKAGLARLFRTDSAVRESQRISPFGITLVGRKVVAEEGITNEAEGWHAPKGSYLALNWHAAQHDEEYYGNPEEYDAFRFSRPREEAAAKGDKGSDETLKMAKMGMVTMSEHHFPFGHGRHSCPGRFFVAHEIKMVIAYLLLNYDFIPLPERPKQSFFGQVIIPPTSAMLRVRRRVEHFGLSLV